LQVWFRWHNGQSLDGEPLLADYKLRSFYLLSAADAMRTHGDLTAVNKHGELSGPWRSSWIPLLESDFGDHLVFESAGKDHGVVRAFWHETPGRETVARDLIQLVRRMTRSLKSLSRDVSSRAADAKAIRVPKGWTRSTSVIKKGSVPKAADLASDSVGTAYVIGPITRYFYPFRVRYVAVKVGTDTWISVEEKTVDEALDLIIDTVRDVPIRKWQHTHAQIFSELSDRAWDGGDIRKKQVAM
jgi:hypothetical protein